MTKEKLVDIFSTTFVKSGASQLNLLMQAKGEAPVSMMGIKENDVNAMLIALLIGIIDAQEETNRILKAKFGIVDVIEKTEEKPIDKVEEPEVTPTEELITEESVEEVTEVPVEEPKTVAKKSTPKNK